MLIHLQPKEYVNVEPRLGSPAVHALRFYRASLRPTQRHQLWTARPDGSLDWVNAVVATFFGRSAEQMLAWGWVDVVYPDDLPLVGERWSASLESGEPYLAPFRLLRHDGTRVRHMASASPQRDGEVIIRWIGANVVLPVQPL